MAVVTGRPARAREKPRSRRCADVRISGLLLQLVRAAPGLHCLWFFLALALVFAFGSVAHAVLLSEKLGTHARGWGPRNATTTATGRCVRNASSLRVWCQHGTCRILVLR